MQLHLTPLILLLLPSTLAATLSPRDQKLSINVYSDNKCANYLETYKNAGEVSKIVTLPYEATSLIEYSGVN
ncbi:hypothetical protein M7I_5330 [Glarea lozoyensis 74030]|uniref:Uncharacterized protein n=1 Tax=Glarea lozoyensis (strain ATCC 74030 / MF5533) TaxID=1104152 RepID=H0ERL1_GLAL7|nr:hypothetical protein M7I_5330 [Glarea lozoyensis 74030]